VRSPGRHPLATRLALVLATALLLAACSSDDGGGGGADGAPGGSDTTVAGEAGEFSLLSYNVAGLPQEVSSENPEEHLPLISPLLELYDVVVTQEDFDWWSDAVADLDFVNYHERLRADTTHEFTTGPHLGPAAVGIDGTDPDRPLPQVGDGLGSLSRFPLADVVRVPWDGCRGLIDSASDCLAMKGFAVPTVELGEGAVADVYTLHAEAGGDPEDDVPRQAQFDQLAAFIAEHSTGRAVIVAGDTNLHLEPGHEDEPIDRPVWEGFLADTGLTDVCAEVDCPVPGAIDKVAWLDAGGLTLEPLEFRHEDDVFAGPQGEPLSDHPAVAVDWAWTAAG
jgi:hypothetical protein